MLSFAGFAWCCSPPSPFSSHPLSLSLLLSLSLSSFTTTCPACFSFLHTIGLPTISSAAANRLELAFRLPLRTRCTSLAPPHGPSANTPLSCSSSFRLHLSPPNFFPGVSPHASFPPIWLTSLPRVPVPHRLLATSARVEPDLHYSRQAARPVPFLLPSAPPSHPLVHILCCCCTQRANPGRPCHLRQLLLSPRRLSRWTQQVYFARHLLHFLACAELRRRGGCSNFGLHW